MDMIETIKISKTCFKCIIKDHVEKRFSLITREMVGVGQQVPKNRQLTNSIRLTIYNDCYSLMYLKMWLS